MVGRCLHKCMCLPLAHHLLNFKCGLLGRLPFHLVLFSGLYTVHSRYCTHRYITNSVIRRFQFGPHIFSIEIVLYYCSHRQTFRNTSWHLRFTHFFTPQPLGVQISCYLACFFAGISKFSHKKCDQHSVRPAPCFVFHRWSLSALRIHAPTGESVEAVSRTQGDNCD